MYRIITIAVALTSVAWSQTLLDLRTQTKSVDFSAAAMTKPMQTGSAVPATCTAGQMFFDAAATAGQNLLGCVATNTWTAESGSPGIPGVTVQSGSTTVGTRSTVSFTAGLGTLLTLSDTGTAISIQPSADLAVMQTRAGEQTGNSVFCGSASGSGTTYTCSLSPTLTSYTAGMVLRWVPDISGSGGPTSINVDTLGAVSVTLADGVTDPGPTDIVANRVQEIWYDGAVFRAVQSVVPAGIAGDAMPTCSVGTRGRFWFSPGLSGTKDALSVCAKDATDTYSWRPLY